MVLSRQRNRTVEAQAVAARHHDQAVAGGGNPGSDGAVLEAHDQLHLHLHRALSPLHDPMDGGVREIGRHEVDHGHAARCRLEHRFQDQGLFLVGSGDGNDIFLGGNQPPAIVLRPQQGRESGPRVDPGGAPPVDRAVAVDQRNRSGVADDGVILDPCGCDSTTPSPATYWEEVTSVPVLHPLPAPSGRSDLDLQCLRS